MDTRFAVRKNLKATKNYFIQAHSDIVVLNYNINVVFVYNLVNFSCIFDCALQFVGENNDVRGKKDLVFRRGVFSPNKRHAPPPPTFQPAGFTFYFHVHLCTCVPPSIKIQACQYISPSRTCDLHAVGFLFSTRREFADNFHPGQCLRNGSSYCFDNGAEREALVYLWYT